MNGWTKKEEGESFTEYRNRYFCNASQLVRVLEKEQYDEEYRSTLEHFGVHSPAKVDVNTQEIIINGDVPDRDYIDFLKIHEIWEGYITNKSGFNLGRIDREDGKLPINQQKRPAHRFATYKEFCAAKSRGKLDEYFAWWEDFYSKDIEAIQQLPEEEIGRISKNYQVRGNDDPREYIIDFIKRNWDLKRQIYEKVRDS